MINLFNATCLDSSFDESGRALLTTMQDNETGETATYVTSIPE